MSTSLIELHVAPVTSVTVTDDALSVDLADGRTVTVPLAWYPRLLHGTPAERGHWRLVGRGEGMHWPELDEDISVENLLAGQPSGESQRSFQRWLTSRRAIDIVAQRRLASKKTWRATGVGIPVHRTHGQAPASVS